MRRKQALCQLLLLAQDCLEKKQPQNSIKILHQVLELEPKNSQAFRLLGDCFDELGQKEEAQKNYKIGIDCNPLSTICYVNYGLLLYNSGKKEEAEKIYQLCMEIDSKDKTLLNNFAILLFQMQKFEKAQKMFNKCLEIDPHNQNGRLYLEKIKQSKQKVKLIQNERAQADSKEDKLLQLLFERDQKLAQKQTQIEQLKKQLMRKQKEIKQLRSDIERIQRIRIEQQSMKSCKICLTNTTMYANKKCGHLSSCRNCLKIVGKNCPLCREPGSFIRVFSSLIKQDTI